MEPIAYVADAESVLAFQNETRSDSCSFYTYRPGSWKREGLRLFQGFGEVGP